ncbi:MAG: AAA family ATPase [Treponema sp.]|nr:AAA family ATPase [Treponema sp.]
MDRRTFEIPLANVCKEDCIAIAGYLFYITNNFYKSSFFLEGNDAFYVIRKFAESLSLTDRFTQVLSSLVELYYKAGELHPYVFEEDDAYEEINYPSRRRNKKNNKFLYEEDKEVADITNFSRLNENTLNFLRLMVIPDRNIYSQIVYYTFFTTAKVSIKACHNKLPLRYEKKMHDISKLKFLQKELNLSDKETEYLLCRYRKGTIESITELLSDLTNSSSELYPKILDISEREFKKITRPDSKLRQYGFINDNKELNPVLIDCIEEQNFSLYFADCIKIQNLSEVYDLSSFEVPDKNTSIYKSLLESNNPISLLLYGAPGAGKTEYAKALIKSTGKKALIFKNEAELMDADEVLCRLNCLLSLNRKDSILIIDEADNLLSTCISTFFGPIHSSKKKGIVNKMLESSQNKVIWIVNYKSQIDESTLRRFTVSYKFSPMSAKMLENIAEKKLNSLEIENKTKGEIVNLLSRYKVTGASVDNLVKAVNSMKSNDNEMLLENVKIVLKDNSTLLHNEAKMRTSVKESYDMSVLNTSIPAEKILKMLQNAKKYSDKNPGTGSVKMLLYGLSGTGKTEFSRYISQCLGKDILLKRASDIFDKYVGGTEQNISQAFQEAAANDMILLFDEADSFFADRNGASRNYERTQVNEFLTQLEEFPGIVICTTNLRNIMDPAMLRRFHITVDFKALTEEGISRLLSKFFKEYTFTQQMVKELSRYGTVTPGDFGRLSDTIKFMDQEDITSEYIVEELCNIQKEKNENGNQYRSAIGFCA